MTPEQFNLLGAILVASSATLAIFKPLAGRFALWMLLVGLLALVAGGWGDLETAAIRFLAALGGAAVVSWQARELSRLAQSHRRKSSVG